MLTGSSLVWLRYHAMGAVIGLDARALEQIPNGLGMRPAAGRRAHATRHDHSYVIIRRPHVGRRCDGFTFTRSPCPATRAHELGPPHFESGTRPVSQPPPLPALGLRVRVWCSRSTIWLARASSPDPRRDAGSPPSHRVTLAWAGGARSCRSSRGSHHRSRSTADRALAYFGLDPSRIDVVHHGVAHAAFPSTCVLVVGPASVFVSWEQQTLQEHPTALRWHLRSRRVDVRLIVTGRGDSIELRRLARQLHIDDRGVHRLVSQDELLRFTGAVALVFPSLVEDSDCRPQAMAAGCRWLRRAVQR